jgi:hypothetical protein
MTDAYCEPDSFKLLTSSYGSAKLDGLVMELVSVLEGPSIILPI